MLIWDRYRYEIDTDGCITSEKIHCLDLTLRNTPICCQAQATEVEKRVNLDNPDWVHPCNRCNYTIITNTIISLWWTCATGETSGTWRTTTNQALCQTRMWRSRASWRRRGRWSCPTRTRWRSRQPRKCQGGGGKRYFFLFYCFPLFLTFFIVNSHHLLLPDKTSSWIEGAGGRGEEHWG